MWAHSGAQSWVLEERRVNLGLYVKSEDATIKKTKEICPSIFVGVVSCSTLICCISYNELRYHFDVSGLAFQGCDRKHASPALDVGQGNIWSAIWYCTVEYAYRGRKHWVRCSRSTAIAAGPTASTKTVTETFEHRGLGHLWQEALAQFFEELDQDGSTASAWYILKSWLASC